MHLLLLSRNQGFGTPDGHQILPFAMHRRQLAARGIRVTNSPTRTPQDRTDAVRHAFSSADRPDAVLVMPHWSEPADQLAEWFQQTRRDAGDARLVMLDYYAPTCSPHFGVLPFVDRYVKRQTLRDRDLYHADFRGGFIYADFVSRRWDFDLHDWRFGSKPDPAHAHKIVRGWNLGVTPLYRTMLRMTRANPVPWSARPIDVHLRVGTINRTDKPLEWYQFSRAKAAETLEPLRARHRFTSPGRVRKRRYFAELFASKIVVSPFGWGEVCFRDYEAAAAGALLVKPDMSHLETSPDVYVANETYLPVQWDYADAPDVIESCLADPKRSARIARAGAHALASYYRRAGFVDDLERCLAD